MSSADRPTGQYVRRAGIEPAQLSAGGLQPLRLANAQPTQVFRIARVGIEPTIVHQGLSLAALPSLRTVPSTSSGRRESRTLKAHRSAVFGTAAVAHRLALPLPAAAAGIEPAIVSLTGSRLTIGPHRKAVRTVGVEPTLSGSRNRRITRLSYVLSQSTQR